MFRAWAGDETGLLKSVTFGNKGVAVESKLGNQQSDRGIRYLAFGGPRASAESQVQFAHNASYPMHFFFFLSTFSPVGS